VIKINNDLPSSLDKLTEMPQPQTGLVVSNLSIVILENKGTIAHYNIHSQLQYLKIFSNISHL